MRSYIAGNCEFSDMFLKLLAKKERACYGMLHLSTWETQEMLEELLRENVKK
jgi:hypothetical protein